MRGSPRRGRGGLGPTGEGRRPEESGKLDVVPLAVLRWRPDGSCHLQHRWSTSKATPEGTELGSGPQARSLTNAVRPSLFRGPWEADVSCQSAARRHLLETPTRFQPIGPGWQLVAGAPSLWKATTAQMLTWLEERISLPLPALLTS